MKNAVKVVAVIIGLIMCACLSGCRLDVASGVTEGISDEAVDEASCAYAVYEAQQGSLADGEFAEKLDIAAQVLSKRLVKAGYTGASVEVTEEDYIRAQLLLLELGERNPLEVFQSVCQQSVFEICDIHGVAQITGSEVKQATSYVITNADNSQEYTVKVVFNSSAAEKFAAMTRESFATGKPLDIKMDGEVISSPVAQEEITGGEAYISGGAGNEMTAEDAGGLAIKIESGAMPLKLDIIESGTTGDS